MTDLLIRDVPDEVVGKLDRRAERLGLSRAEFLRRQMMAAAAGSVEPVTRESLVGFAEIFCDLADDEVMDRAWR